MGGHRLPKGLPEDVKAYLVDQVKQAVESDTFKKYTEERGTDWNYMSPDELYALAKSDMEKYAAIVEDAGLAQ